jgi:hypothetical protein
MLRASVDIATEVGPVERASRRVEPCRARGAARRVVAVVTAAVVGLAASAAAVAEGYVDTVDLEIPGNAKVRGTLRSAAERESFRLRLPQGAKVAAKVRRQGTGFLVPRMDLVSEATTLAEGTVKGRGAKLASEPLPSSGDFALRVYGNGVDDGDYSASVRVTVQKTWKGGGSSAGDGAPLAFSFGAPAGAQARIRVTPAKGSGFVPALDGIAGPGFAGAPLSGAATGWVPLGGAGTYDVSLRDGDTAGGDWTWTVQVRAPRGAPASVDISASAVGGAYGSTQQVYGAQIGADGGTADPPDLGTALDGASISVPPGSLGFAVVLTLHVTDPIDVPPPDNAAGPTIRFGPSGTTFGEGAPAIVSIPYDRAQFGNPANEMTVYVRDDATGEVTPVLPRTVYDFSVPGVVSFPVAHFSSYVAAGSRPRSAGDAHVVVRLQGGVTTSPDTQSASELLSVGDLEYQSGTRWVIDWRQLSHSWRVSTFEPDPSSFPGVGGLSGGAYPVATGDRTVRVRYGDSVNPYLTTNFLRARGGDVWLDPGNVVRPGTSVAAGFALPQTEGAPTRLGLAGRWHLFFLGAGADQIWDGVSPRRVRLGARGGRASVTISPDGTWKISKWSVRASETEFPEGTWEPAEFVPSTATASIYATKVAVSFTPALGVSSFHEKDDYTLTLCAGGDVLVGTASTYLFQPPLVILVRESTNLAPSPLAGLTTQVSWTRETLDAGPGTSLQGFRWAAEVADVERTLPRAMTATPTLREAHQINATGGTAVDLTVGSPTEGTWTLASNGAYSDSTGAVGAVTPSGDFLVAVTADGKRFAWTFAIPGEQFSFP